MKRKEFEKLLNDKIREAHKKHNLLGTDDADNETDDDTVNAVGNSTGSVLVKLAMTCILVSTHAVVEAFEKAGFIKLED